MMEDFAKVFEIYKKQLKNLGFSYEKILICFSGVPGSGKTYLSKILEEKYNAVRVNNDDLRDLIRVLGVKEEEVNSWIDGFLNWFFDNYSYPNGIVILDSSIDRRYKRLLPRVSEKGWKVFIIRMEAPRELLEERVKRKLGGELDRNFMENIDRWISEWEDFGKDVSPNVIIKNDKDEELDLTLLHQLLKNFF